MNIINSPIEMIAEHKSDGFIRPIRFRITTSNGEDHVIKITALKHVYEEKLGTKETVRKFLCLVIINDVQRLCEIGYNINTMKWTLLKM